ncbi:MAG: hypothetical protein SFY56_02125 [Bacteroidota bacterium]|nr:hypothetical protein [Bacteroidota bacterium]
MKLFLKILISITFCLSNLFGQNSRLTNSIRKGEKLYKIIQSSALLIPIKDWNSPEDRALMTAVRRYWKQTPYQFISQDEMNEIRKSKISKPNRIYLIKETYERLKKKRKDWAYTKYYITEELGGVEVFDSPYIEFKLPVKTENREVVDLNYEFIYGLMIKQLNYDISLMSNKNEYKSITKKSLSKANFKNNLKSYANKMLLVSQSDLENYMMNLSDSKKTEKQKDKFIRYISKKTKLDKSNIKFVTEEDIKIAVSIRDPNSIVYTGFTLYNTEDGKMLRRIDASAGKRKVNTFITLLIASIVAGTTAAIVF